MTDDRELDNPGAFVFKPSKDDDGQVRYSSFGKPVDLNSIPDTPEHSLAGIFTERQKWLDNNKDWVKELHEALASLPEPQRQAVDLLFFQKLSFRDAGNVIGIKSSSMYDRYLHAIASLQQYFQSKT